MGSEDRKRIADVIRRMRDDSPLSQVQRRCIECLADMSWAGELDAL